MTRCGEGSWQHEIPSKQMILLEEKAAEVSILLHVIYLKYYMHTSVQAGEREIITEGQILHILRLPGPVDLRVFRNPHHNLATKEC